MTIFCQNEQTCNMIRFSRCIVNKPIIDLTIFLPNWMTYSNDDHTAYSYSVVNDRLSSNHFDWWFQNTHPAAESSHFTFHPTMLQHSHPRLYGGRLANTRLVSTTVRVANVPTPINTIEKPPGSRAHQRGTTLFRFRPEPTFKCCKKKCMSHFLQEDDPRVEKARAPLFVPQLSKDDRRLLLRQNWKG